MDAATVTALTSAFNAADLLDTFIAMAPFIISIVGIIVGVSLAKWGVRTIRKKLSGGV